MMLIISILILLLCENTIQFINAYDLNADLARGLVGRLSPQPLLQGKIVTTILSEYAEDCAGLYLNFRQAQNKTLQSGVYEIWPRFGKPIKVLCDMETDGGGWIVFQKRDDFKHREDFYRTWVEYKRGFGDLEKDFWLGNDRLSILTNQDSCRLRVDLEDFDGQKKFALYSSFRIAGEGDKYRLTLGSYQSGDAGDSMRRHENMMFSTKDQDNDIWPNHCAQAFNGAWWYEKCHDSNLNGGYLRGHHPSIYASSVNWYTFRGYHYSLKRTEMKIRPAWFKP